MSKDMLPDLKNKIHTIRGKQVMLDRDLAEMYGVETKVMNQAVKRNKERFPIDFCFKLSKDEFYTILRSQIVTSSSEWGGIRYHPYVFTEHGVTALAGIVKSKEAIKMNIKIIRAFVAMRHFLLKNADIFARLDTVERKQIEYQIKSDENFNKLFTALENKQLTPNQGIFYDGQIYDAHVFVVDSIKQARKEIILIDPYIDTSVLTLMSHKAKDVKVIIYTKELSEKLKLAEKKFNKQYGNLTIKEFTKSHDRFLVIDSDVYHIGASLKCSKMKFLACSKSLILNRLRQEVVCFY